MGARQAKVKGRVKASFQRSRALIARNMKDNEKKGA